MKTNVTTGIVILMLNGEVIAAEILRPISKNRSNVFEKFTKILREKGILTEDQSIHNETELRDGMGFILLKNKGISITKIEKDDTERDCNSLIAEINYLSGIVSYEEGKVKEENAPTLISEILNLWNGCGEGYVEKDWKAESRYYSKIPGVKNIRIYGEDGILVKVRSRIGYLLPDTVNVNGRTISITFCESSKYDNTLDY